jgi:hypothetical protein
MSDTDTHKPLGTIVRDDLPDEAAGGTAAVADALEVPIQISAAVLGASTLAFGVAAVFSTDNGAGSSALIAAGLLLLVIAAFGHRIAKISGAGVEVEIRERAVRSAARVQNASNELRRRGDEEGAASLAAEAEALLDLAQAARPTAAAYEQLRETMAAGPERTRRMEGIVASARADAPTAPYDTDQVRDLFYRGNEGDRVYALGLMQGNPRLRDFGVALDGIRRSRSAFEQYHALTLAREMLPDLRDDEKKELAGALESERRRYITPGTDRWGVAQRILSELRKVSA